MIARLLQGGKYKKARNHRLKKETVEENDQLIKQFLDDHEDLARFWQDFCLHIHENQHYIWAKFDKTGWWCKNHYSFKASNSIPSSENVLFMYQYYYNLYYEDRDYNWFANPRTHRQFSDLIPLTHFPSSITQKNPKKTNPFFLFCLCL